jgi:hypothetical protein
MILTLEISKIKLILDEANNALYNNYINEKHLLVKNECHNKAINSLLISTLRISYIQSTRYCISMLTNWLSVYCPPLPTAGVFITEEKDTTFNYIALIRQYYDSYLSLLEEGIFKVPEKEGVFKIRYEKKINEDAPSLQITEIFQKICLSHDAIYKLTECYKDINTNGIAEFLFNGFKIPHNKIHFDCEPSYIRIEELLRAPLSHLNTSLNKVDQAVTSFAFSQKHPKVFLENVSHLVIIDKEEVDRTYDEIVEQFIGSAYAPLLAFASLMIKAVYINNIRENDINIALINEIYPNLNTILTNIKQVIDTIQYYFAGTITVGVFSIDIEAFKQSTITRGNSVLKKLIECIILIRHFFRVGKSLE